jgi:hypothetical protein
VGPLAIVVHLASVWVPFTSEAKEAVAHYDDLMREMKLAVQEYGRKLGTFLRARARAESEQKRLGIFQRYIPEVAEAIGSLLGQDKLGIEQAFYGALPLFVRVDLKGSSAEGEGGEGGSAPPEATPTAKGAGKSPEPPAKPGKNPKGKGKKSRGSEQASLASL